MDYTWHRWVGHGTMVLLTLHGFGFYGVWLYTAEYTRGLVWDRTGEHSPIRVPPFHRGGSSLFSAAQR